MEVILAVIIIVFGSKILHFTELKLSLWAFILLLITITGEQMLTVNTKVNIRYSTAQCELFLNVLFRKAM